MSRKIILSIIIIASLSMIGIIITQVYWVKRSYHEKEVQFENSVRLALKGVVNQMVKTRNDSVIAVMNGAAVTCFREPVSIYEVIDQHSLDSLLRVEFNSLHIDEDYLYGVYEESTGRFVTGFFHGYQEELQASQLSVSMLPLCRADNYLLLAYFPSQKAIILQKMLWWIILSVLFIIAMIFTFAYTMFSVFKQKKLSKMKSDFVNNMTHEFKTPISTISLASEMLLKPAINKLPDKTEHYARIIFDENVRLKNQVEQVLNIAVLDKGEFRLKVREFNVHETLHEIIENFSMIVKERQGSIKTCFEAERNTLRADKVHFTNIIFNLLDNANKYSPEYPRITVTTSNMNNGILISVIDKGIGISAENQHHVFKKLYRISTGNIHDVKGFGLGLFYVKTMVDAHGGHIRLKSELNKGSRFELYFPFDYKNERMFEDEKEQ